MKKLEAQHRFLSHLLSRKEEEGFTLIELLVVVIIAGVLAAIGIPAWQGMRLKTQAAGAKTVIANIKKECQSNLDLGVEEVFTPMTPSGYSLQPRGSLSCYGDPGTGLVSAVPNEVDKNPTYFYEHLTGLLSEESVEAKNLPPNESIAFGPDSGLSCREVKSSSLKFMYGNHYLGSGSDITLQPVTITIGDKSWEIKDVKTRILGRPHYEGTAGVDLKWLDDFANKTVEVINESEGGISAEIDTNSGGSIKIYSPTGAEATDIAMRVEAAPYSNINSYAFPALGKYDPDKYRYRGRHPNEGWNEKTGQYESKIGSETTTVCDGR